MRAPCILAVWAALAAVSPTAQAQVELRLVGFGVLAKRNATLDPATAGAATTTMGGGQLSLRGGWIGLAAGFAGGDFTAESNSVGGGGKLAYAEGRAQLGPRIFAVEGGYARRAVTGALGTMVYSYYRAGAAALIAIGGTGLTVRLSGALYLGGAGVPGVTVSGHDIVSMLEYQVAGTPIVINVGYRGELFDAKVSGTEQGDTLNGIVLGGGLKLGH